LTLYKLNGIRIHTKAHEGSKIHSQIDETYKQIIM